MSRSVRIQRDDDPGIAVGVILDALTKEGFPSQVTEETEDGMTVVLGVVEADPTPMDLLVDSTRMGSEFEQGTGIFVRAKNPAGRWGSFDIVQLQKESLLTWLRSRPNFAEQTALILLGHNPNG